MKKIIAMATIMASITGVAAATDDIHNTWLTERATMSTTTSQVSKVGYMLSFNPQSGNEIHGYNIMTDSDMGAIQPAAGSGMGSKVPEVLKRSHDKFAS